MSLYIDLFAIGIVLGLAMFGRDLAAALRIAKPLGAAMWRRKDGYR